MTNRTTTRAHFPRCTGNCNGGRAPCDCPTGKPAYQFLEPREKQEPMSPGEKVIVAMTAVLCVLLAGALVLTAMGVQP